MSLTFLFSGTIAPFLLLFSPVSLEMVRDEIVRAARVGDIDIRVRNPGSAYSHPLPRLM